MLQLWAIAHHMQYPFLGHSHIFRSFLKGTYEIFGFARINYHPVILVIATVHHGEFYALHVYFVERLDHETMSPASGAEVK